MDTRPERTTPGFPIQTDLDSPILASVASSELLHYVSFQHPKTPSLRLLSRIEGDHDKITNDSWVLQWVLSGLRTLSPRNILHCGMFLYSYSAPVPGPPGCPAWLVFLYSCGHTSFMGSASTIRLFHCSGEREAGLHPSLSFPTFEDMCTLLVLITV